MNPEPVSPALTMAEPKVLTLFGSGKPLCFCGALAERQGLPVGGRSTYSTLCHVHWKSERELLTEAIARAGQRLRELGA